MLYYQLYFPDLEMFNQHAGTTGRGGRRRSHAPVASAPGARPATAASAAPHRLPLGEPTCVRKQHNNLSLNSKHRSQCCALLSRCAAL